MRKTEKECAKLIAFQLRLDQIFLTDKSGWRRSDTPHSNFEEGFFLLISWHASLSHCNLTEKRNQIKNIYVPSWTNSFCSTISPNFLKLPFFFFFPRWTSRWVSEPNWFTKRSNECQNCHKWNHRLMWSKQESDSPFQHPQAARQSSASLSNSTL